MPLDELADALNAKTHSRVMRVDRPLPAALSADGVETPFFLSLPFSAAAAGILKENEVLEPKMILTLPISGRVGVPSPNERSIGLRSRDRRRLKL